MTELASPDKYFGITLDLCAVRNEDWDDVHAALVAVRDKFSRGGSGIDVHSVRPQTVVNR